MNLLPRYVAPAGAPIGASDLMRWVRLSMNRPDGNDQLLDAMRSRWGPGHYFLSCTGRAGMTLLLRAMRQLRSSDRDEVVVPSYTCYSVPASAVKAGLRVRIVDIDPATLDYDPRQLAGTDFSRVLAIVATNLYGLPSDLPGLARLARDRGVFLIDDAAQAMGASVVGRWSGTWGDAGLFSFDKGKNVSSIDGGVVFTASNDLAAALEAEWAGLASPSTATTALHLVKVLAYTVMLRPRLYGIPARMPSLGLGRTVFTTDFPLEKATAASSVLGAVMLQRLERFTDARVANARALAESLGSVPGVRLITPRPDARPAYLRLPVYLEAPLERDAAIAALNAAGVGATGSYPASLVDVPELRPALAGTPPAAPGGRMVARRIMTLPTHPFVTAADMARMRDVLRSTEAAADATAGAAATPARIR
jgi:dTDP-4-amino-4,6-dideoxygalactose transaminase